MWVTPHVELDLLFGKWLSKNKTRGLRRWPTRETIVLRCNKLNPRSTEIFEIKVRNSDLFWTSVPTSKECVHNNKERSILQSWRYPKFCWISSRKYANYQTDRQTYKSELLVKCTNISGMSPKNFRKIFHPELEIFLCLILVRK